MERMKIINVTEEEYEEMKSFDSDEELIHEQDKKGEENGQ